MRVTTRVSTGEVALEAGGVTVTITPRHEETANDFVERATAELRRALVAQQRIGHARLQLLADACSGLTIDLVAPGPAKLWRRGELLEGEVGPTTAYVLVRVVGRRELLLRPNRHGQISAHVGADRVL